MKSTEQLVAAIRDLRFAIDRLSAVDIADAQPAVRQALISQARALQADSAALLEQLGEDVEANASELVGQ